VDEKISRMTDLNVQKISSLRTKNNVYNVTNKTHPP